MRRFGTCALTVFVVVVTTATFSQDQIKSPITKSGKYLTKLWLDVYREAFEKYPAPQGGGTEAIAQMEKHIPGQFGQSDIPTESIDTLRKMLGPGGRKEAREVISSQIKETRSQLPTAKQASQQFSMPSIAQRLEYILENLENELDMLKNVSSAAKSSGIGRPKNKGDNTLGHNSKEYLGSKGLRDIVESQLPTLKEYPYEIIQRPLTKDEFQQFRNRGVWPPNCLSHVLGASEGINPTPMNNKGKALISETIRNPYSVLDHHFVESGQFKERIDANSITPRDVPVGSIAVYEERLFTGLNTAKMVDHYLKNPMVPKHVAKKRPDGRWESQLGNGQAVVLHADPRAVEYRNMGRFKTLYIPK